MSVESESEPGKWRRHYDLFLLAGGKRFYFRNTDRGITLTDWELRWTAGGKDDRAPLENIASVRLQTAGFGRHTFRQCMITFRDGYTLAVVDSNEHGSGDPERTPVYREFVRELHARLALAPPGTIAFVRGLPKTNFYIATGGVVLLALMLVVTPFVVWIWAGAWEALFPMAAGIGLCWPMYKMARNNAPQDYDPKRLPEELLE